MRAKIEQIIHKCILRLCFLGCGLLHCIAVPDVELLETPVRDR